MRARHALRALLLACSLVLQCAGSGGSGHTTALQVPPLARRCVLGAVRAGVASPTQ